MVDGGDISLALLGSGDICEGTVLPQTLQTFTSSKFLASAKLYAGRVPTTLILGIPSFPGAYG